MGSPLKGQKGCSMAGKDQRLVERARAVKIRAVRGRLTFCAYSTRGGESGCFRRMKSWNWRLLG